MSYPIIFIHAVSDAKKFFSEDEVVHFLNARPEVITWIQLVDNVYAIDSTVDAVALYSEFKAYIIKNGHPAPASDQPRHAFVGFDSTSGNGVLAKAAWTQIRAMNKKAEAGMFEDEIPF